MITQEERDAYNAERRKIFNTPEGDKHVIQTMLNNSLMGLIQGSPEHLIKSIIRRFKLINQFVITEDNIKVVIDELENPKRVCWSIHMEYDGVHYESLIRNMSYDTGEEDYL